MDASVFKKIRLPDSPGIYIFKKGRKILYIGRATSIRERTRSYFSSDLIKSRGRLIFDMVGKADRIVFKKTDSVLEAVILEANLIKKYQPKYNTDEKDDKSFSYMAVVKGDFPVVKIIRGRNIDKSALNIFGPFPNSGALKEALKFIRRIFPYRDDKCRAHSGRPCFNYGIGLCPGVCLGAVNRRDYAKNISGLVGLFSGKKKSVVKTLEKRMREMAREMRFEEAGEIKKKIFALRHIRDVAMIKADTEGARYSSVLQNTAIEEDGGGRKSGKRGEKKNGADAVVRADAEKAGEKTLVVEAYDIAHLGGKEAVGVVVSFKDGEFDKHGYRTFIIRSARAGDDIGALKEVLERRLKHRDWPYPDIILTDGGEAHRKVAEDLAGRFSGGRIRVFSVVKDEKHRPKEVLPFSTDGHDNRDIFFRVNAEAHRFAIRTHTKRRKI